MANDDGKGVALKLTVSNDLNTRLEELANAAHTSPAEILRWAFMLYDVAAQEKVKNRNYSASGIVIPAKAGMTI